MNKKELGSKLGLVVFGIFLALALVEVGFRMAGGLLSLGQELRNRRGLSQEGTYRILCLGESTTQDQWPPLLQEELNKNNMGTNFKVIDKGKIGTSTGLILSQLDRYLDEFKPQMVVVMMGVNDGQWVWKDPKEYKNNPSIRLEPFLTNMRVNKLATYIINGYKKQKSMRDIAELQRIIDSLPETPGNDNWDKEPELALDPKNPLSYIDVGKLQYLNGEYNKAEKTFSDGIKMSPHEPLMYVELGKLYRAANEIEKAENIFKLGIKMNPNNPHAYVQLGKLYFMKGEYNNGEKVFESGIKVDPSNVWLNIELGNSYRRRGDRAKAQKLYEATLRSDPKNAWAYAEMRYLYYENGEIAKAEQLYKDAIKIDPRHQWAYTGLGEVYCEKGAIEDAIKIYRKGIQVEPGNPQADISLGNLYKDRTNELGNAGKWFIDAMRATPKNPIGYHELGDLCLIYEQQIYAQKVYEKGCKATPHDGYNYAGLAALYDAKHQDDKAERFYKAAIIASPLDPHFYAECWNFYARKGKYEKAVEIINAGLREDPDSPWLFMDLSAVYQLSGDQKKAVKICAIGIKANPTNPWMYLELGKLYLSMDESNKAQRIYEAGIKANPGNSWIYLELGKLLLSKGQQEKGEDILAKGYELEEKQPKMSAPSPEFPHHPRLPTSERTRKIFGFPPLATIHNYQKLRGDVINRGIKLVSMQYPMRSVDVLKGFLGTDEGIIFVENKFNFEEALKTSVLTSLFIDFFAGDFGHCTPIGNSLIAQNLAGVILKELSGGGRIN